METLLFVTRRTPPLAGIRQNGCLFSLFSACEGLALEKSGVLEPGTALPRAEELTHVVCRRAGCCLLEPLSAGVEKCRTSASRQSQTLALGVCVSGKLHLLIRDFF